jgi:hypothetical protein
VYDLASLKVRLFAIANVVYSKSWSSISFLRKVWLSARQHWEFHLGLWALVKVACDYGVVGDDVLPVRLLHWSDGGVIVAPALKDRLLLEDQPSPHLVPLHFPRYP